MQNILVLGDFRPIDVIRGLLIMNLHRFKPVSDHKDEAIPHARSPADPA